MAHYLAMTTGRDLQMVEAPSDAKAAEIFAASILDDDTPAATVYVYLLRDPKDRVFRVHRRVESIYDVDRRSE